MVWVRKPVPSFPGYYVGNDGSVWSAWRLRHRLGKGRTGNESYMSDTPRKLKCKRSRGYHFVTLYKDGKAYDKAVHRLVLETFAGPCPAGKECCHKDGKSDNNSIGNLYWGTHQENVQDQIRHGTFQLIIDASVKALTGKPRPSEVCAKISVAHKGIAKSEEHKEKIKASHWSKRPDAAEIAARAAAKNRGKKHSDEHRAKISEGNKRRWARARQQATQQDEGS